MGSISRYLDILGLTSLSLSLSLSLSRILFPEDNEVEHSDQRCFNGEDYCEHSSSYPAAKIAKALQKEDSAFLRNMLTQANDHTKSSGVWYLEKLRQARELLQNSDQVKSRKLVSVSG